MFERCFGGGGEKNENNRLHETDEIILVKSSPNCVSHNWRPLFQPSIPGNRIKLASTPVTCVIPDSSCFLSHSLSPKHGGACMGKAREGWWGAVMKRKIFKEGSGTLPWFGNGQILFSDTNPFIYVFNKYSLTA